MKYVKPEIGQEFNQAGQPDPLFEIRFDDVYFDVWNTAPDIAAITDETHGRVRTLYTCTFTTIDPDQNSVTYEIKWGDNTTQMAGPFESGEEIKTTHIWGIKETYRISVRAYDKHQARSDSVTLDVTMPYSYTAPIIHIFIRVIEWFPHASPIQ